MKLLPHLLLIALLAFGARGLAATVTPTPKTTYGSWDSMSALSVSKGTPITVVGWGADTAAKPTTISGVVAKIFVDGAFVSQVPVGESRPDVADYYGFENSGFTATIDTSSLTPGAHTIEIRVGGGPSGWNVYTKSVSRKGTVIVTEPKPAAPGKS